MPRISSYTPAWLSRPSPGFDFFNKPTSSPSKPTNGISNSHSHLGPSSAPSRTVACRGSEVFTVVGSELRWSDLGMLKERWEAQRDAQRHAQMDARRRGSAPSGAAESAYDDDDDDSQQPSYRVLKVPVSRKIRQIVTSPGQDYLAIITSHTAHIAVLPDASHLFSQDMSPLKLKTFQLGPTIHVIERSPVAAALWHPLGASGAAFVTVTADAVVRLWELDPKNRWSFDMPPLEFDLKKLADGRSSAEDFSPSKYGTNKSFSPDSFEMEVASAAFGGDAQADESPWSAMTLWVAMRPGDIYALCPLLPAKWQAPSSLLASLSTSIQCRSAYLDQKATVSKVERKLSDQRLSWITEINKQPLVQGDETLSRPSYPGSIPKLQGPFQLAPDPEQAFEIADIHVFCPTPEQDSQTDVDSQSDQLSAYFDLVCVATNTDKLHICASLDPVEGCWLPPKRSSRLLEDEARTSKDPELLVIESISLSASPKDCCPLISSDKQSHNSVFVTHSEGVAHVDLAPLAGKLLDELNDESEAGVDFRIGTLVESSRCQVDQPIKFQKNPERNSSPATEATAAVDVLDSEFGHFILAVAGGQAHAVTLDDVDIDRLIEGAGDSDYADETDIQGLFSNESRPSYQPPEEFWSESTLASFMDAHVHSRGRRFMTDEVRLSPTTLSLLMEAHRVLSHETHRLGVAAADLFSRCERLQGEFKEQLGRAHAAAEHVDAVLGDDADPYDASRSALPTAASTPAAIEERLAAVKTQQHALVQRYDELRRKVAGLNGRALTDREKAWAAEVASMGELVGESNNNDDDDAAAPTSPKARFDSARGLKEQLVPHARALADAAPAATAASDADAPDVFSVAPSRRRTRLAEINGMMERQTALVEATREKLQRLDAMAL